MKKILALALAALLLTLAGCGKAPQSVATNEKTAALLDAETLKAAAYEHAGVAAADVLDVDTDWEKRGDTTVFELDFEAMGVEYEYGLDGYTGKIIYSTFEGTPMMPEEQDGEITAEQAKKIALEHAKYAEESIGGLRAELDREDGDYEVEFYADGFEYEYEIDLYTGEILRSEKDRD